MKSFKQYIAEAEDKSKGWFHLKKKKVIKIPMRESKYHVGEILRNLKTYGVSKKDAMKRLVDKFDAYDSPDPDADAKKFYDELRKGVADVDYGIEELAMKKGWFRFYGGKFAEVGGIKMSKKTIRDCVDFMETQGLIGFGGRGTSDLQVIEYKKDGDQYRQKTVTVLNTAEIGDMLRGRSIGTGRTEIGRTMAMFREAVNECWSTHVQKGYKMKGGKRVPNCVPRNEDIEEGVRDILRKLGRNKKVMSLVSRLKGQSVSKLAATLATIPIVQDTLASPDRMNQLRIIANGLRSMTEEDND